MCHYVKVGVSYQEEFVFEFRSWRYGCLGNTSSLGEVQDMGGGHVH